jgi:hypothetical protein
MRRVLQLMVGPCWRIYAQSRNDRHLHSGSGFLLACPWELTQRDEKAHTQIAEPSAVSKVNVENRPLHKLAPFVRHFRANHAPAGGSMSEMAIFRQLTEGQ